MHSCKAGDEETALAQRSPLLEALVGIPKKSHELEIHAEGINKAICSSFSGANFWRIHGKKLVSAASESGNTHSARRTQRHMH